MLNIFWWLVTIEAIGLAAFPIAYFLLPRLSDRGYTLSKPLGLLLVAYASWILSVLHIMPSVRWSVAMLLVFMGAISAAFVWRKRGEFLEFLRRERRTIIAAEVVFLVIFAGWIFYRAYDPAIDHTEQPMDFAFLNAVIESTVGQPEDPWLKGESISYYYFGYWMMGSASQLTGIPSNVSYNLSLALIPALGAMGIFGLVFNMVSADSRRWRYAIASGVAAGIMMSVVTNLEGVLEFMRASGSGSQAFWDWIAIDGLDGPTPQPSEGWTPEEFWWWFRATRVINTFDGGAGIDYTIHEFPFFSFILGDLHPHVMSIPFTIMFIGFVWNYLRSPILNWTRRDLSSYATIVVTSLLLGGLAFTNMWDFPTYATLFIGAVFLHTYTHRGGVWRWLIGVGLGIGIVLLAVLFYLPYYLTFNSSVSGIGVVETATRWPHMFLVWGIFLLVIVPLVVSTSWQARVSHWKRLAAVSLLVGFLPFVVWAFLHSDIGGIRGELLGELVLDGSGTGDVIGRFFHIFPFAALISIAVYNALSLSRREGPSGKVFALVLAALGLMLIMGPELLFIRDSFGSRMNTVFKLYYQAWILLAASSGFAIYYWRSIRDTIPGWTRSLTTLWAGLFILLVAVSLYYPAASAVSKSGPLSQGATLDGLAYLSKSNPAEHSAIQFVKANVDHESGIVEWVGEWFDAGLISRSTGVPTVLNWPGHEIQWRGSSDPFQDRERDIERIYQTQDPVEAKNLLDKYNVRYVYVGPRERDNYGADGIEKFGLFMDRVFNEGNVMIYEMRN